MLSHRSAGVLWGFLDRHVESGCLEVIVSGQRRLHGVSAHRQRLGPGETTRREGIPVTTAERTLFDLAGHGAGGGPGAAVRRGVAPADRHPRPLHAIGRSPPRARSPAVGADPGGAGGPDRRLRPGRQRLGAAMDRLWDRLGLPAAERQYPDPGGRADLSGGSRHRGPQDCSRVGRVRPARPAGPSGPRQRSAGATDRGGLVLPGLHLPVEPGADLPDGVGGGRPTRPPVRAGGRDWLSGRRPRLCGRMVRGTSGGPARSRSARDDRSPGAADGAGRISPAGARC